MDDWTNLLHNQTFPAIVAAALIWAGIKQNAALSKRIAAIERAYAQQLAAHAREYATLATESHAVLCKVAAALETFTQALRATHAERFPQLFSPPARHDESA